MEEDVRILINSIRNLAKQTEDSNSFVGNFWRGVLFGLGWAIGTTVVAGAVIAVITSLFQNFRDIPFFK